MSLLVEIQMEYSGFYSSKPQAIIMDVDVVAQTVHKLPPVFCVVSNFWLLFNLWTITDYC